MLFVIQKIKQSYKKHIIKIYLGSLLNSKKQAQKNNLIKFLKKLIF